MIVVHVAVQIKPEQKTAFLDHFTQEISETIHLDGCNKFTLYADTQRDNRYILYEEWESVEAFNTYKNSPLFKQSGEVLFPMFDGAPDSIYYDAQILQEA